MGKGLLVIILGSTLTLAMMNMSLVKTITSGTDKAADYFEDTQSRNNNNSMVNILLSRIADNPDYRTKGFQSTIIMDEELSYRIVDSALSTGNIIIKIESIVEYNGYPKKTVAFVAPYTIGGWVPGVVRGGWTANADLNNTISDMYIDGRNHDLNLNVIPNSGVAGVSSSVEFRNDENAEIGGTLDDTDYAPQYPEDANAVEEFYNWGTGFPTTPDEVLGFPEGTLKAIAQSGVEGSQYLLDPKDSKDKINESHLTYPLNGVTYIELTDGVDRQLYLQGGGNKGIIIVHGPNNSSELAGLKMEELELGRSETIICHNWNTKTERTMVINEVDLADHLSHGDIQETCGGNDTWFNGMIITDYSFHHHLDILGAMIQLSPNLEDSKNCNGNADHWVKFSKEAVESATQFAAEQAGIRGNNPNYFAFDKKGIGNGRVKAVYWYE